MLTGNLQGKNSFQIPKVSLEDIKTDFVEKVNIVMIVSL
jgi:hypothetical protein